MTFSTLQNLAFRLSVTLFFLVLFSGRISAQDKDSIAIQYILKGKSFYKADDYEKSITYYNKALALVEKTKNDVLIGDIHTKKGHAYLLSGKNKEALDAYDKGLSMAKKTKDLDQEFVINSGLIQVLRRMNRLDKAHTIASGMIKSLDQTSFKNTHNHVNILTTVSDIYLAREQYDSVLFFSKKGIEVSKNLDYKEGLVDFYIKKGMIFYYKKEYDKSFKYLFDAQDILLEHDITNQSFPKININYFLASSYYEKGLYDKAIEILHKTTDVAEEKDVMKPPVIQSYLLLANCYGEKKDFEKALYWNNEYVRLIENYQKDKDETLNSIYEKDAQKLKSEIENLKKEKEKGENIKKITFGIVTLLVLILIFIVFKYVKKQKLNKILFNDLLEKINQLESNGAIDVKKESSKEIIIDDDKVVEVLKGLTRLEDQEYFLKSDCSLRAMAKKVKTNATYLSKIINIHKEKNFNDYINDLRIEYALMRIKNDKKFRSFSIKSIATEIGYKSDYSFAKHFKAKTGINPSYYIKNIQKQETSFETV
ncbi:tetratricopeptide repeat protein [Aquimarina algiphila]|uniref:tetratricopeptide repeat protein n=1 Tax=Aquimarina algiphila TaxID=2047982 RepID=UPI0023308CE6|nr:tetratricopeptide repeat protein [Aquimarina algiphila]